MILPILSVIGFAIVMVILWRIRKDTIQRGEYQERIKNDALIEAQNNDLIEEMRKQKEFINRINTDKSYADGVRDAIERSRKK